MQQAQEAIINAEEQDFPNEAEVGLNNVTRRRLGAIHPDLDA